MQAVLSSFSLSFFLSSLELAELVTWSFSLKICLYEFLLFCGLEHLLPSLFYRQPRAQLEILFIYFTISSIIIVDLLFIK